MNEPKFNADIYRDFRPLYPPETFREVVRELDDRMGQPISILDLGCGTGLVTRSLLELGPPKTDPTEITLCDPDAPMLQIAKQLENPHSSVRLDFVQAGAEKLPFADRSFDLILVGSAFHWFKRGSEEELSRVIRPGGKLLVFEYQFPKAQNLPALNDWVKKNFNQHWKAPDQTPRGKLKELIHPLRLSFELLKSDSPPMIRSLDVDAFLGHLISQSRYQHFEAGLQTDEIHPYRQRLKKELEAHFKGSAISFDFYLQFFWFVSKVTHCQTQSVKRK